MSQYNMLINNQFSLAGIAFNASAQVAGDIIGAASLSVPVAQPGVLTTRSSDTAGDLTMTNNSHGITTGAIVDLYWTGGIFTQATVGTVSGNTVPIASGTGTLPVASTAIVACVCKKKELAFTNANVQIIAYTSDFECIFKFIESDDTTVDLQAHLQPAAGAVGTGVWYNGSGVSSPFSGTAVQNVWMSHADPNAAHVMSAAMMST